jgi:glycine/serine hydroxymethyltransferase
MDEIGDLIVDALEARDAPAELARLASRVTAICDRFPVPGLPVDASLGLPAA